MNPIFIRNGLLGLAVIVLLGASTYKLSEAPAIWFDEGMYTQLAMNMAEGKGQVLLTSPGQYVSSSHMTVGYPFIAPVALSYALFGAEIVSGRAVMVLFIFGLAAVSYFLIYRLFGAWPAVGALFLLATFPMLYGNGKSVLGEVPGLFYLALTLVSLYKLEQLRYQSLRWYVLTGLTAGLCAVTKPLFLLLLGALGITLLIKWRGIQLNWSYMTLGIGTFLVAVAVWVYVQFGADTHVSAVLAHYANPYYGNDLLGLIIGNALRFVTELTPLYTLLMLLTWGAALFVRRRGEIPASELAAFIFSLLTVLSFLRIEGWYRYLFPATTVALIFLPSSLQILSAYMGEKWNLPRFAWLLVVLLLGSTQLYQTMFHSFIADSYAGTRTRTMSELRTLDPSASILLYNTPELALFLPSKNYSQYLIPFPRVAYGSEHLDALKVKAFDIVIVEQAVAAKYPELFARYAVATRLDRYEVLERNK